MYALHGALLYASKLQMTGLHVRVVEYDAAVRQCKQLAAEIGRRRPSPALTDSACVARCQLILERALHRYRIISAKAKLSLVHLTSIMKSIIIPSK